MSDAEDLAKRLRRLRNERRNLVQKIERVKKLADSEARTIENEISMLREGFVIGESKRLTDSQATTFEIAVSMLSEEPKVEESKRLINPETAAFESAVNMLREDLTALKMRMDMPVTEPEGEAKPSEKPWGQLFR